MFGTKLKAEMEAQAQALEEARQAVLARDAQIAELKEQVRKAVEFHKDLQDVADGLNHEVTTLTAERDDLAAKLAAAEEKLATKTEELRRSFAAQTEHRPSATKDAVDGEPAPVAEGVVDGVAETWEEAVRAEGGSYSAAREKHPDAFRARFPNLKI